MAASRLTCLLIIGELDDLSPVAWFMPMGREHPNNRVIRGFFWLFTKTIGELKHHSRLKPFLFDVLKDGQKGGAASAFGHDDFGNAVIVRIFLDIGNVAVALNDREMEFSELPHDFQGVTKKLLEIRLRGSGGVDGQDGLLCQAETTPWWILLELTTMLRMPLTTLSSGDFRRSVSTKRSYSASLISGEFRVQ